jgi:serine/threonine protein phosphatase 1
MKPGGQDGAALRTYAVGDVHGRLDLLRAAVQAISDHVGDLPFRVVFLGDYVDRGPDSRGVIDFLIDLQRRWTVICLKGNHEELMVRAVEERGAHRLLHRWLEYGGRETLRSYGLRENDHLQVGIPAEHLRWMADLPRTTRDEHRIFVHAGLTPGTPVHQQTDEACLWIRDRFLKAVAADFEAHVVHGHTPIWEGKPDPAEPELLEHRTNLDTGAFVTGVLTVAVFNAATPGGPIEVLRIKGAETSPEAGSRPALKTESRRRLARWFPQRGERALSG